MAIISFDGGGVRGRGGKISLFLLVDGVNIESTYFLNSTTRLRTENETRLITHDS